MELLRPLVDGFETISITGMCKNAGKTTVLNTITSEYYGRCKVLALTSVGRDGEALDLVTGTYKPPIYVEKGTLAVTVEKLVPFCDITREIAEVLPFGTPMGRVVILRALSDGFVQLAGPSMTEQVVKLKDILYGLGAEKIIVDGAINRRSLCSARVGRGTILCSGASYDRNIDTVVRDTAYICNVLMLEETEKRSGILQALQDADDSVKAICVGEKTAYADSESLIQEIKSGEPEQVYIRGALTDSALKPLLTLGRRVAAFELIAEDSSRILLSQDIFRRWQAFGGRIRVLNRIELLAVTSNPYSAYGFHFDGKVLAERLREEIGVPVIDVMEGKKR